LFYRNANSLPNVSIVFSKLDATSAMFLLHWGKLDAFSVVKNLPQKIP
jgi:hypothetical protein